MGLILQNQSKLTPKCEVQLILRKIRSLSLNGQNQDFCGSASTTVDRRSPAFHRFASANRATTRSHFFLPLIKHQHTPNFQPWPRTETQRKEPRSSRPSALNATLLSKAVLISKVLIFMDSSVVNLEWPTDIHTLVPTRRVEFNGAMKLCSVSSYLLFDWLLAVVNDSLFLFSHAHRILGEP